MNLCIMSSYHVYVQPIILLIGGASLCVAVLTLVNLVSHTKYVCNNEKDDNDLVLLKAMEWLLVILSVTLCALLIIQRRIQVKVSIAFACVSVLFGGLLLAMHEQSVCSDCLQENAAEAAFTSDQTDDYQTQVRTMLGGIDVLPPQLSTAVWFKTPENYCRSKLLAIPDMTDDYNLLKAETCLLWACAGNFVPGSGTTFNMTVAGFFLLAFAAFGLVYVEQAEIEIEKEKSTSASLLGDSSQNAGSLLRPKSKVVPLSHSTIYKRVPQDFHF